ncbi:hypothetical protein LguiA_008321 [Lonicera macranthoides]
MRVPLFKSHIINLIDFNPNPTSLKLFHKLHNQSSLFSSSTSPTHLNTILNTATKSKNIKHATQIHTQIIANNFISLSFLLNNLLNFYAKCGHFHQTLTLFSSTRDEFKNVVTWTTLITQFSHYNKPNQALGFFNEMRKSEVCPNQFTFSALLSACADMKIVVHGENIHSLIRKHGFEFDLFVGSALVDMYAKCGVMESAETVFDEMPERNLVSWNSMIVGFLQNKLYGRAVGFFKVVIGEVSVCPNQVSFSSALSACANMGSGDIGRQVHVVVIKHGLNLLVYVKNSLMDMYSKCGFFEDAVKLFKTIEDRDVVTWNIMVMGCAQNDNFEEACYYFWVMRREGISPDEASFSTVLYAAANIAALDRGTLIHNQIIKTGFRANTCISSSLITMYAKCGSLVDAQHVFHENENRNVVSWTAMISACQQHGCAEKVIALFETMLEEGIKPNYVTFVCILSACSHAGRVDEGYAYFYSMTERHNVNPGPEHYACMVDLLGRTGKLDEAMNFAESMPIEPNASVWGALLGACRNWSNLEMGRKVAERLFEIEPDNPGNYVLLCNMYARSGKFKEADDVRRLMGVKGVKKEIGCSW